MNKEVKLLLDVIYKKHTEEDWDTPWCIVGDEGVGKSNFGLHIVEDWVTRRYGKCTKEDIKYVNLERKSFKQALAHTVKRFDVISYDEAGELSNRRFLDKFNYEITQAYQMIRGENLLTLMILPSFFDLDPFFSKRRVKGLFYVYQRGRFAFWSKNRLRRLAMINQNFPVKNYWVVPPTLVGYYPKYKGVLKDSYDELKRKKMQEARENLLKEKEKKPNKYEQGVVKLAEKYGQKEVAEVMGLTQQAISYTKHKHKLKSINVY